MPEVEVSRFGGVEGAMRKLKRILDNNLYPRQWRELEFYTKPTEQRKRDADAADKRYRKKQEKEEQYRKMFMLTHKMTLARQHKVNKHSGRRYSDNARSARPASSGADKA